MICPRPCVKPPVAGQSSRIRHCRQSGAGRRAIALQRAQGVRTRLFSYLDRPVETWCAGPQAPVKIYSPEYTAALRFEPFFYPIPMHPLVQSALGGILIGLASWLLLASLGRVAGISGIAAGALAPSKGDSGWRWAFLTGLVLGGAATAYWLQPPLTALRPSGL